MRTVILTALTIALVACTTPATEEPAATETAYDAALAETLGADDYGMRPYVMVILKTGPNDATLTDPETRSEIFKGHFANITALAESGELVLAGPFSDPDKIKRGLYIFDVKTVEEAEQLVLKDPAVEAGIFTAEFTPYYGSAALKTVNDVHQRIAKVSP